MKRLTVPVAVLASAVVVLGSPLAVGAGETQCVGVVSGGNFDNVVVPPGQSCTLRESLVLGTVKALENSRLIIRDSNVRGGVDADKADLVQVLSTMVRQNISIKGGGPATLSAIPQGGFDCEARGNPCEAVVFLTTVQEGSVQIEKIVGSVVLRSSQIMRGNVKAEDNFVPDLPEFFSIEFNPGVAQSLQVFKNVGPGAKAVTNNTVGQSLQCFENSGPFVGTPNTAGQAEGQCEQ